MLAFQKATKRIKNEIRIPKFELLEIEDYYTYFVLILKIDEYVFWNADISFLNHVIDDYSAYKNWLNYEENKLIEKSRR